MIPDFCFAILKYNLNLKEIYTYKDAMQDKFTKDLYLYMQNTYMSGHRVDLDKDVLSAACSSVIDPEEYDKRIQHVANLTTITSNLYG